MKTPKRPLIAVDVDLTLVDTLTPWFNWISQHTQFRDFPVNAYAGYPQYGVNPPEATWAKNYDDLPGFLEKEQTYPIDKELVTAFWKQPNLYQTLKPIDGAVQSLNKLSRYADIVFVTHCFPGHIDSKRRFLDSQFLFKHDFVDTKAKHLVNYDVIIDDNVGIMRKGLKARPRAHHIFFKQIFSDVVLRPAKWTDSEIDHSIANMLPGIHIANDWADVVSGLQGLDLYEN